MAEPAEPQQGREDRTGQDGQQAERGLPHHGEPDRDNDHQRIEDEDRVDPALTHDHAPLPRDDQRHREHQQAEPHDPGPGQADGRGRQHHAGGEAGAKITAEAAGTFGRI